MGIQLSKDTPIHRIKEENRQRVFVPLHLFPHLMMIVQPPIQEFFFNLFSAADMDFPMA